ncbi:MAG: hypothetical protein AAF356_09640 [Planctomycetota bacterium]
MPQQTRSRSSIAVLSLVALVGAACLAPAPAVDVARAGQPVSPAGSPARSPTPPAPSVRPKPPVGEPTAAVRLGKLAREAQAARRSLAHVVIVPDAESYLSAISAWGDSDNGGPGAVFPVLIDDGSDHAAEQIARFVRAYRPESVLLWQEQGGRNGRASGDRIAAAHADATRGVEVRTPGLVAINPDDGAWAGGLALAAGRGQRLAFVEARTRVNGSMSTDDANVLLNALMQGTAQAAAQAGDAWQAMGDDIDAITLAFNEAGRIQTADKPRAFLAMTDAAGRLPDGKRWAWAGQLIGDAPDSAYRAMSSLFLPAVIAWGFDGYADENAWAAFDMTAAGALLDDANIPMRVLDTPRQGIDNWRADAASGALPTTGATAPGSGLILINSKGRAADFELQPGLGRAGDVPWLDRPAAVHMVHSFSAQSPGSDRTIAGRFLANGAFVYAGSVHEPGLNGFVQTPQLARRMINGEPFSTAARHKGRAPWRIAVLGDPLWTLGGAFERAPGDQAPGLSGASGLAERVRDAAGAGDFGAAIRGLVMLGNDADAARLAAGLLNDRPAGVSPDVATASMGALVRTGNAYDALRMYAKLDAKRQSDRRVRDLAWHAGRSVLQRGADQATLAALRVSLREDQLADDALEVARWIERDQSPRAAGAFLRTALDRIEQRDRRRRAVEREASRLGG